MAPESFAIITPTNPTLRDVITQMIITSDNTATDLVIAKVGGKEMVNEFLKQNGITTSFLVQTVFELFRKPYERLDPQYKSLSFEDVSRYRAIAAVHRFAQGPDQRIHDGCSGRTRFRIR